MKATTPLAALAPYRLIPRRSNRFPTLKCSLKFSSCLIKKMLHDPQCKWPKPFKALLRLHRLHGRTPVVLMRPCPSHPRLWHRCGMPPSRHLFHLSVPLLLWHWLSSRTSRYSKPQLHLLPPLLTISLYETKGSKSQQWGLQLPCRRRLPHRSYHYLEPKPHSSRRTDISARTQSESRERTGVCPLPEFPFWLLFICLQDIAWDKSIFTAECVSQANRAGYFTWSWYSQSSGIPAEIE